MSMPLLTIKDLAVTFQSGKERVEAVKSASLDVSKGEAVALVGESGSGKSVTALSVLKLLPKEATYPQGSITFDSQDVFKLSPRELRILRGKRVGMIFQEPLSSLNPLHTVEKQIGEMLMTHQGLRPLQARERVKELLEIHIHDPAPALSGILSGLLYGHMCTATGTESKTGF